MVTLQESLMQVAQAKTQIAQREAEIERARSKAAKLEAQPLTIQRQVQLQQAGQLESFARRGGQMGEKERIRKQRDVSFAKATQAQQELKPIKEQIKITESEIARVRAAEAAAQQARDDRALLIKFQTSQDTSSPIPLSALPKRLQGVAVETIESRIEQQEAGAVVSRGILRELQARAASGDKTAAEAIKQIGGTVSTASIANIGQLQLEQRPFFAKRLGFDTFPKALETIKTPKGIKQKISFITGNILRESFSPGTKETTRLRLQAFKKEPTFAGASALSSSFFKERSGFGRIQETKTFLERQERRLGQSESASERGIGAIAGGGAGLLGFVGTPGEAGLVIGGGAVLKGSPKFIRTAVTTGIGIIEGRRVLDPRLTPGERVTSGVVAFGAGIGTVAEVVPIARRGITLPKGKVKVPQFLKKIKVPKGIQKTLQQRRFRKLALEGLKRKPAELDIRVSRITKPQVKVKVDPQFKSLLKARQATKARIGLERLQKGEAFIEFTKRGNLLKEVPRPQALARFPLQQKPRVRVSKSLVSDFQLKLRQQALRFKTGAEKVQILKTRKGLVSKIRLGEAPEVLKTLPKKELPKISVRFDKSILNPQRARFKSGADIIRLEKGRFGLEPRIRPGAVPSVLKSLPKREAPKISVRFDKSRINLQKARFKSGADIIKLEKGRLGIEARIRPSAEPRALKFLPSRKRLTPLARKPLVIFEEIPRTRIDPAIKALAKQDVATQVQAVRKVLRPKFQDPIIPKGFKGVTDRQGTIQIVKAVSRGKQKPIVKQRQTQVSLELRLKEQRTIQQEQRQRLLLIPLGRQKEEQPQRLQGRLLQGVIQVPQTRQRQRTDVVQISKVQQAQVSISQSLLAPVTRQVSIQAILPKQEQRQRLRTRTKLVQDTVLPGKPLVPPTISRRQVQRRETGFLVEVRRGGVFKAITKKAVGRVQALGIGIKKTKTTLARTFRLVPTKQRVIAKKDRFRSSRLSQFRAFRKVKGRKIPLKDTFIQRRRFSLGTRGERKEIQFARKKKIKKGTNKRIL